MAVIRCKQGQVNLCNMFWFSCRSKSRMACHNQPPETLSFPEENDETLSEEFQAGRLTRFHNPKASFDDSVPTHKLMEGQPFGHEHYPVHHNLSHSPSHQFSRYDQQTPYPSQADANRVDPAGHRTWHYPSYHSRNSEGGCPNSLPSYLPSTDAHNYPGVGFFLSGPHSLPGSHSPGLSSLEQPRSLHSFLQAQHIHTLHPMPYPGLHRSTPCCPQCGPVPIHMGHPHHLNPRPGYHLPYSSGRYQTSYIHLLTSALSSG